MYLSGACPQLYDGQGWLEHGFHFGIDWETSEVLHTSSTAGVGGMTAGTRAYVFVPEYTLSNGEVIQGSPSKPYEVVTTGTNDRVTLSIPPVTITQMSPSSVAGRAEARIGVFRTVDGDASALYRCSSLDPSATGANGYVTNVPSSASVTFIDDFSDDTLETKQPLYTNGGILENDPIATGGLLVGGKGRLFADDPSNGSAVLFSQERAEGYILDMPDGLRVLVDDAGGEITALGILDDALVIFKRSAIYFVAGAGPLANPDTGGFSPPQIITADCGCTSPKSIVSTSAGLMFKSAKGIYLLGRDRQVTYIGAPVEAYNAQDITRATLIDDTTQVRFLTSSGSTLLYDYLFGQWSTFTNHEGVDAVNLDGVYHYLRNDGTVFVQSPEFTDNGNRISMALETAWLHFQEHLQGFQRFWHMYILGARKSGHTLRVQYRTDYSPSWSAPIDLDASDEGGTVYGEGIYGDGPYGGSAPSLYQFKVHLGCKGTAIQLRFSDRARPTTFRLNEQATFVVNTSTISVPAGTYSATSIAALIQTMVPGGMTFAISAAGVPTFTVTGTVTVTWTSTELRDLLGYSGNVVEAASPYTGDPITQFAPHVEGAAFEITELLITGGVKGPASRVPASRSA